MIKWRIGDRVCRNTDVYDQSSSLLCGTVINRYSDYTSRFGPYPELYEVEWDGGIRQRGFLPHGLDALAARVPVVSEEPKP